MRPGRGCPLPALPKEGADVAPSSRAPMPSTERRLSVTSAAKPQGSVNVQTISKGDAVFAYVVRADLEPKATTFVTHDDCIQQVGFVVHREGSEVRRHFHLPVKREIVGTPEVLVV